MTAGPGGSVAVEGPVVLTFAIAADDIRLAIGHRGGPPLHVREWAIAVNVNGTPLRRQLPIPSSP